MPGLMERLCVLQLPGRATTATPNGTKREPWAFRGNNWSALMKLHQSHTAAVATTRGTMPLVGEEVALSGSHEARKSAASGAKQFKLERALDSGFDLTKDL